MKPKQLSLAITLCCLGLWLGNSCQVFAMQIPLAISPGGEVETKPEEKSKTQTKEKKISITNADKIYSIKIGDELFTKLDCQTYAKPILYPIYGHGQIGMTRNWPMKEGVAGEAHDHPHHKSMWIAHEMSGIDFWAEKGGKIVTSTIEHQTGDFKEADAIRTTSSWIRKSDGETLLTDQTIYRFGFDKISRWIDCEITFRASHGDFQFDDTKEGLFAVRTHPDLRLKANPKHGVTKVFGKAVNSEGVTGKDVWGKPAKWMLYYGPIDGHPMSIAMYDYPTNLGHPTTWHARDYGLVTANPFGQHHFLGKKKGAGAHKVKQGKKLTLRYRMEFISGAATAELIARRFESLERISKPVQR